MNIVQFQIVEELFDYEQNELCMTKTIQVMYGLGDNGLIYYWDNDDEAWIQHTTYKVFPIKEKVKAV